jgi:RHS repeat-associated protein
MPNSTRETVLCRYHYDPLDRQNGCTVPEHPPIQRFHCDSRLTTEIQGGARWSILQHGDQLLAQRNHLEANVTTTLLATDQQRSVLNALNASQPHPIAYTPYGHHPAVNRLLSLRGFNGEQPDPLTGHYHLGNGYRQFNPVLMRFNSPDSWSPFGKGGINAYAYCEGDPANRVDPNGRWYNSFIKELSKNIARSPKHPTKKISKETTDSFVQTMERFGGKKEFKKAAKQKNFKPKDYLINQTPETRKITPSDIDMTTNSILDREHAQKVINRFELLITHGRVSTDIFYGVPKLHRMDRIKFSTRLNALTEEKINLSHLYDLAKQPIPLTSPPPSYEEVIMSDRKTLPSYAWAIRMGGGN